MYICGRTISRCNRIISSKVVRAPRARTAPLASAAQHRYYAAEVPDNAFKQEKVDLPGRSEILQKITSSPDVMKATVSMIELMEKKGLNSETMPTPEEWEKIMADQEIQDAIKKVGQACDEAGVPMNAQVLAELTGGLGGKQE